MSNTLAVIREPGSALFDDIQFNAQVENACFAGNSLPVEDVELALGKRRRDFVLDDFYAGPVADDIFAVFDLGDAADVQTLGCVELQCVSAGRRFRVAEHHADFHTELIDENHAGVGFGKDAGELAKGLGHEACLQSDMVVPHFAVDFRLRNESGDRVDDDEIDGSRTHQGFGDIESLFARIGLGNQKLINVDSQVAGIDRVKSVLRVNKGSHSALFLRFGNGVEGKGRFSRRLRSVDFDDASARESANSECHIQLDAARRDDWNILFWLSSQRHDGTLAEILFNLCDSRFDGFSLFSGKGLVERGRCFLCHFGISK